jgi:hypothetical protein
MEQVSGFEPELCGFADRRLWPLGYTRQIGMRGRIRTFIDLFLRQAPLRLGYTHVVRTAGFEPANT